MPWTPLELVKGYWAAIGVDININTSSARSTTPAATDQTTHIATDPPRRAGSEALDPRDYVARHPLKLTARIPWAKWYVSTAAWARSHPSSQEQRMEDVLDQWKPSPPT